MGNYARPVFQQHGTSQHLLRICRKDVWRFWDGLVRKRWMRLAVKSTMSVDLSSSALIMRSESRRLRAVPMQHHHYQAGRVPAVARALREIVQYSTTCKNAYASMQFLHTPRDFLRLRGSSSCSHTARRAYIHIVSLLIRRGAHFSYFRSVFDINVIMRSYNCGLQYDIFNCDIHVREQHFYDQRYYFQIRSSIKFDMYSWISTDSAFKYFSNISGIVSKHYAN